MQLSIQEIMDFQKCPTLYKFRYIDKVDVSTSERYKIPNKYHLYERFDQALHLVAYGLFHQIADGRYPNAYYIKKRWGDTWNNNRTKEDVLFDTGSWRNEHRRLERSGLKALL